MLASDVTGEYAGDPENDGDPENEGLIPGEKCGLAFGESPGAFFAATCAVGAEDS
jgi:hypothetical protein